MKFLFFAIISFFIVMYSASDAYSQQDTIATKMSFDLGFTRGKNVNLLPLYKRIKTKEEKEVDILFPFYGFKHNYVNHSKRSHLYPAYWSDSTSSTHDLRLLTFYYPSLIHISKEKTKELYSLKIADLAPEINFLEYTRSKDGQYLQNNIFFFLWYNNNKLEQKSHLIFFPLYWSFHNKEKYFNTLIPLYFAGSYNENRGKYLAITPFYWHLKENDKTKNIIFPLWWDKKSGAGENYVQTKTLFPIYWSFKDNYHSNMVLFPLIWSYNTPKTHSFTFFPVFSRKVSTDSSWNKLMITPLFLTQKNYNSKKVVLFPLWWYKKSGSGGGAVYSNTVFPIFWSYKGHGEEHTVLFPFLWTHKNPVYTSFTIFPFYSQGISFDSSVSHIMNTPLFWHFRDHENSTNILFPFWLNSRTGLGKDTRFTNIVFPFYWHFKKKGNDDEVIFPFVWHFKSSRYKSTTDLPFFSTGNSPDNTRSHLMITPLFWEFKKDNAYRDILFPLYYSYKDNVKSSKILFPLLWVIKDTAYQSVSIAPLYSSGRSADGKTAYVMATPLFWHFKSPDIYRNIFFPLWWNSKKGKDDKVVKSNVIFPVYWSYKDKTTNNKIVFPFVWRYKNKDYTSFTLFPVFSSGHTPDGKSSHLMASPLFWHYTKSNSSSNILFPFWWNSKTGKDGKEVKSNVFFPVYWSHRDSVTNNKIFFPLIWRYKNKNYNSFTLFPVFSSGHTPDGKNSHLMLSPFFWHFKNPGIIRNMLYPIWWNKKIGNDSNAIKSNMILAVYWSYKDKITTNRILFPFIWRFKNYNYHSFTLFPIFSTGHTVDKQNSHLLITPFFWHFKRPNAVSNIFFPIWWHSKKGIGDNIKKSNVIFPIYWAYKDKEKTNKILFPILWKLKNPDYNSFTLFPLISTGHSFDNRIRHFVLTPLFWNIHSTDAQRLLLFPLFNYYNNKSGRSDFSIFYFLFHSHNESGIRKTGFLLPLCLYEKRPDYKYFRFAPLVWYKKSPKDNYFSVQPFFYHRLDSVSESYNIFWELLTYKKVFNVKKSKNFLWKTVFNDKYTNGDHEFRILYFLYANMNKEGKIEHGLFPFYRSTKDNKGNKSLSVFFYFYNSFERKIEGTNELYRENDIFWFVRYRSNYRQLKEKGIDEKHIRQ